MPDIAFVETPDAQHGKLATVILDRPKALNALSQDMFLQLHAQLVKWQSDDSIKAILIKSSVERAFCAGGDIRSVYENKNKPIDTLAYYFELEYSVNKLIAHYPKPVIPLLNNIVMGGGVGISVHASHPVAADNLQWSMPETLIGFFADVGASYYLSRLPDAIGIYLALTGKSITSVEAHQLTLVKYVVSYPQFSELEKKLLQTPFHFSDVTSVDRIIDSFSDSSMHCAEFPFHAQIATCFSHSTLEDIVDALNNDASEWSVITRDQLSKRSPTSLKVTLQQLQLAKHKTIDAVLEMDAGIAKRMLTQHDFFEGIRALIVDKDKNPHWEPSTLSAVNPSDIARYFSSENL